MERYLQASFLLSVSGLIAYAILGYGRDCLESGKVVAKDGAYKRESDPLMFWMTTISVFIVGTLIPTLVLLMTMGVISI
jgi:hypothetical protein